MVIRDGGTGRVSHVIEVKRARAPDVLIEDDVRRLAMVQAACPSIKTCLVILSESHRPARYVAETGKAVKEDVHPGVAGARTRVRRVWKASGSFEAKENSHYVCLLEVTAKTRPAKRKSKA